MNMKSNDKETEETEVNEEDASNPSTIDVNINDNYYDKENDYEIIPDTPTNGENNETIDNDEEKNTKKRLRRKQIMEIWI